METKLEDLTSSLVEVYHKLDEVHFDRILNSYGQRFQIALLLGVYESLEADDQVRLLHRMQTLAGGV